MFGWWAVSAYVVTFRAPFKGTGNGHFATWGAFGISAMFCTETVPIVRDGKLHLLFAATAPPFLAAAVAAKVHAHDGFEPRGTC